jgi:hypothetical protein
MTNDPAEADRRYAVRREARAWRAAEAIDDAALRAIEAAYADDRRRLGPGLRALVAVFTFVALGALLGILALLAPRSGEKTLLLLFGLALLALTEVQLSVLKRTEAGAEAATALLGVVCTAAGVGLLSERWTPTLVALLVVCAAAAWRWGYPLAAAVATIALLGLLARFSAGRLLWIVAGLLLPPLFLRAGDSAKLPPSLRTSARAVAGVALLGLYLAFHIGSWDHGIVEEIGDISNTGEPDGSLRLVFMLGTALVPLGILAAGLRSRRRELLALGLLLALASSVTLRFYVHVAPLWVVLSAGGLAAIALGLGLVRLLRGGPGRERAGFTAEPLFGRASAGLVELAAALASFSPAPQAAAPPGGLKPGGGRYGGGGASGSY